MTTASHRRLLVGKCRSKGLSSAEKLQGCDRCPQIRSSRPALRFVARFETFQDVQTSLRRKLYGQSLSNNYPWCYVEKSPQAP